MKRYVWLIIVGLILSAPLTAFAGNLELFIYSSDQRNDLDPNNIVHEYTLNEVSYNTFMVKGFTRAEDGSIDLTANIKLIDPSGVVLFAKDNFDHLRVTPPEDFEYINFKSVLEVVIEDVDPVGLYTLDLEVVDNISAQTAETKTTLLYIN